MSKSARRTLSQIAEAYLDELQSGGSPDLEAIVARHPDLEGPIRSRLRLVQMVHRAAGNAARSGDSTPESRVSAIEEIPDRLGPFGIIGLLGRGASGVVYRARDRDLDREVAVKVPRLGTLVSAAAQERFLREARSAARLKHPGIVAVHEIGTDGGVPYIVSELVEGRSLAEVISRQRLSVQGSARLVLEVARALDYAHEEGIIHRDVKPGNILIDAAGRPHVSDFGLARFDDDDGLATLTLEGQLLGTPAYMSPEQAAGRRDEVGPASDVYSLGVILFELLTGERPFQGTRTAVVDQVIRVEPRAPRLLDRAIPVDLETITLKALAKEPSRRYSSSGELAAELERFLDGKPIRARRVGPSERLWRWSRRNPVVAGLIALVLVLLVTVAVVSSVSSVRTRLAFQEARTRLSRLDVATGFRHVEEGDLFGALAWFAEAYRLDEDDPDRALVHRLRIEATLSRCPKLSRVWTFDDEVMHVAFSPNERQLVAGSQAGFFLLENDTAEKHALGPTRSETERGWTGSIGFHAEFSPDGSKVLTAHREGVRVWSIGEERVELVLESRIPSYHATFSPDGRLMAIAGLQRQAIIMDLRDEGRLHELSHSHPVHHVAFSPDGTLLATASAGGKVNVFRVDSGEFRSPGIHRSAVQRVEFSRDGRYLVSASVDRSATIWEVSSLKAVHRLAHSAAVHTATFSPDGTRVLTTSQDGSAALWDTRTGERILDPIRHDLGVHHGMFGAGGRLLATASYDGTAAIRDASTGELAAPTLVHGGAVTRAVFSPDGRFVATASSDFALRLWDLAAIEVGPPDPNPPGRVRDMAPDGTGRFAIIASRGDARVWNLDRGSPVSDLLFQDGAIERVALSPAGDLAATASDDEVMAWDARTARALGRWRHEAPVSWIDFSDDGRRIASAGAEGARVVNASTGEVLLSTAGQEGAVAHVELSPDGSVLVTSRSAAAGAAARLWDTRTGTLRGELVSSSKRRTGICMTRFDPAGRRLATAGIDETARIWDVETASEIAPVMRHDADVLWVDFDASGALLATASIDGTARVWNAATGDPVTRPLEHGSGAVAFVAFSPDGRFLTSAQTRGSLRLWDVETGEQVLPEFGRRVTRVAVRSDRILTAGPDGFELWLLGSPPRSADAVVEVARLLSGRVIDPTGGLVRPDFDTLTNWEELWRRLARRGSLETDASADEIVRWLERGVQASRRAGDQRGALRLLDRLIEGPRPSAANHLLRANLHAKLGDWTRAAADSARAIELGAQGFGVWYVHIGATLAAGDLEAYRRACARLRVLRREGRDRLTRNDFAWIHAAGPDATEDWDWLLSETRETGPDAAVGALLYRAGQFESARDQLAAVVRRDPSISAWTRTFLAMAHARLGDEQASSELEIATRWYSRHEFEQSSDQRAILRALLEEARRTVNAAAR